MKARILVVQVCVYIVFGCAGGWGAGEGGVSAMCSVWVALMEGVELVHI